MKRSRLPDLLFAGAHMHDILEAQRRKAAEGARKIDADRVLAVSVDDLVGELYDEFVANPIELHSDAKTSTGAMDLTLLVDGWDGREVEVEGTAVEWHIPFTGDAVLFNVRPSTWGMNPPRGDVRGHTLVIRHEGRSPLDPEGAKARLTSELAKVEKNLDVQRKDLEQFNTQLERDLREAIERRREKVLADRELDAFLDVPVPEREGPSPTFAVDPPGRPRPAPLRKPTGQAPFAPEPAISDAGFAAIVTELASVTAAVERLPNTFVGMPEESLRDVLLVVLNNRFGPATGETFSRAGKTDILIPYGSDHRAVFIAECKWWKGPAGLRAAIDQLLGYVTWRDTKAALVVFSDRKDPSAVAAKANEEMVGHPLFKRSSGLVADQPAFVIHHPDDRNREVTIALIIVPVIASDSVAQHDAVDN